MTSVLLALTLLTGPTVDSWRYADAVSILGDYTPSSVGAAPAKRLDRQRTLADGFSTERDDANRRCVGAEELLRHFSPGWDVTRMSHIMYRESRCKPGAWNAYGRAAGLLQITPITYPYLSGQLGTTISAERLFDPVFNVRAAAQLFQERGYQPWATS